MMQNASPICSKNSICIKVELKNLFSKHAVILDYWCCCARFIYCSNCYSTYKSAIVSVFRYSDIPVWLMFQMLIKKRRKNSVLREKLNPSQTLTKNKVQQRIRKLRLTVTRNFVSYNRLLSVRISEAIAKFCAAKSMW